MGPYVVLWAAAALYVGANLTDPDCQGLCAIYHGFLAYVAVFATFLLCALTLLAQLAFLAVRARRRPGSDGLWP